MIYVETEVDIMLKPTLRDSLQYKKLAGDANGEGPTKKYSNVLLLKLVKKQLVYLTNPN